jgi:hypothetical protein
MDTTFGRARRRHVFRRFGRRNGHEPELLSLDEAERRLRPFERRYLGISPIPVAQVVGTDSRRADFDRDFLPRRAEIGGRWRNVEHAFPDGDFPPLVAYQLGDAYFVIDGHHRVAIARQRGMEMIDAEVTELVARWHLHADADVVELIHAEQQRIFMVESGLDESRPTVCINFSRPVGYIELLENVQIHGYHLMRAAGRILEPAEIAADWYDRIYRPALGWIEGEGIRERDPDATDGDLFLWLYRTRRERAPECGCPPLEAVSSEFIAEYRSRSRFRRFVRRGSRSLATA